MNDRKDGIIFGLLVMILIRQVYAPLVGGGPATAPAGSAAPAPSATLPPVGWPPATSDPEERMQPPAQPALEGAALPLRPAGSASGL